MNIDSKGEPVVVAHKWKKRWMKVSGWLLKMYSYGMFRYTKWNTRRIQVEIRRRNIDKLHVGCGLVLLNGWINILYEPREEYGRVKDVGGRALLNYNLLKQWPVDDSSIRFIAGSHFIEHLDLNSGIAFVKEGFRTLKPGGVIRLSCPDLEIYARNYCSGDKSFFEHKLIKEWCAFSQAETAGEIFAAKAYDSGGSHKWFYDFDSLRHILELAGFQEIKKCSRLEGKTPGLEDIELSQRELETVYIEATKR